MIEHGPDLDPFTADGLLDGDARIAGTPLSDMLDNLSAAGPSDELSGELAAVEAMAAVMATSTATVVPRPRRRMTARAVALAATGTLAFSGVAAAAGLPVPIVSDIVSPEAAPSLVDIEPPRDNRGNEQGVVADDTDAEIEAGGEDLTARDETQSDAGPGSSDLAHSDCGKPNVETTDVGPTDVGPIDVEQTDVDDCGEATNHGKFVSNGAKESNRGEAAEDRANVRSATKSEARDSGGTKGTRRGGNGEGGGR